MTPLFCIHCRWYQAPTMPFKFGPHVTPNCSNPEVTQPEISLVTGEVFTRFVPCHDARKAGGRCGISGLYWEKRP